MPKPLKKFRIVDSAGQPIDENKVDAESLQVLLQQVTRMHKHARARESAVRPIVTRLDDYATTPVGEFAETNAGLCAGIRATAHKDPAQLVAFFEQITKATQSQPLPYVGMTFSIFLCALGPEAPQHKETILKACDLVLAYSNQGCSNQSRQTSHAITTLAVLWLNELRQEPLPEGLRPTSTAYLRLVRLCADRGVIAALPANLTPNECADIADISPEVEPDKFEEYDKNYKDWLKRCAMNYVRRQTTTTRVASSANPSR